MQKYVIALYIRLSIEDYKYDSIVFCGCCDHAISYVANKRPYFVSSVPVKSSSVSSELASSAAAIFLI